MGGTGDSRSGWKDRGFRSRSPVTCPIRTSLVRSEPCLPAAVPLPLASPAGDRRPEARTVALLEVDPDLGAGLTAEQLPVARRHLLAPVVTVPAGPWTPDHQLGGPDQLALVVVSGLVRREVVLGGRHAAELLGPGDVVPPDLAPDGLVPVDVAWTVDDTATLVVLDGRFNAAARVWPALSVALHRRLAAQAARTSVHLAIAQLNRVDLRVLALLWHLAERWGVVAADGVVVPLRLTHATLGRFVGAQRPTVTLALQQLSEAGDLARRPDGAFVLRHGSAESLAAVAADRRLAAVG